MALANAPSPPPKNETPRASSFLNSPSVRHLFDETPMRIFAPPIRRWRMLAAVPPPPPPHYYHRRSLLAPPSPPWSQLPPPPSVSSTGHPPSGSLAQARSIPVLLPLVFLFFLVICFLSIFLFRDILHFAYAFFSREGRPQLPAAAAAAAATRQGLDPTILASFPTLPYSLVKGLQEGKYGAECAVCLSEFTGGDVIRLLTVCCHAFHPPCIDSWLATHATCPLCRSDLEAPPDEAAVIAVREAVDCEGDSSEACSEITIDVDGQMADGGWPEKTGQCVEQREERVNEEVS